ncbi:MAG: DsrE family protein [Planctomycetota bacterium]|nr:DsrE family protein [Planctomycetota bacterium]
MSKRTVFSMLSVAGALVATALWTTRGAAQESKTEEPLRVVVHVNFAEPGVQGRGLKNIANVLKMTGGQARVEVVCHGPGIGLLDAKRSDFVKEVQALMKDGVTFVACEQTMKLKSILKSDLIAGVGTVPSGTIEILRKQQFDHYSYFKP